MKKFLSAIIAIVMTLSLTITAFAADTTYSVTIENNVDGHTYEAYQIFKGDLHDKVLSNIVWGSGQSDHTVGSDAKAAAAALNETDENTTAQQNVEKLAQELHLTTPAGSTSTLTAEGTYVISGLEPGYYLIKDKDNSLNGKDEAYTKFIVKIVGNATATPKSSKPTVDKQVLDEIADKDTMSEDGWGETADHAINEVFQYKLIANIPNEKNIEAYKKYKLVFHDTMTEGITFDSIESVTVTAADGTSTIIEKKDDTNVNGYVCTATAGEAGASWTLTVEDLLKVINNIRGAKVEVIYNAHLNRNAQVGSTGNNENKVYLEYSNNPNVNGEGDTGNTPEDIVWVFTLTMDNTKIDGDTKAPLAGAGFRLYDAATKTEIPLIYDEKKSAYRPVADGESGQEMFSADGTGKFDIIGVDAGSYILKETTVPGGYNKCDDIEVRLEAVHSDSPTDPTAASCTITKYQNDKATNTFTIENNKGAELPETGGMGTVIFYVVGGILVAGAVIVIITRRRMAAER